MALSPVFSCLSQLTLMIKSVVIVGRLEENVLSTHITFLFVFCQSVDGEWGDHMMLYAVANVVSSTVRVLSVQDGAPSWTHVEPLVPHEHNRVLNIANARELHYTSLRCIGNNTHILLYLPIIVM